MSEKFTDLPFIKRQPDGKLCYWHVPPIPAGNDYQAANRIGRQYAGEYIEYLLSDEGSNGVGSGQTHLMIADMARHANSPEKAYAVGFWSAIEQLIAIAAAADECGQVLAH